MDPLSPGRPGGARRHAVRLAGSLAASLLLAAIFVQQVTASRATSAVVDEPAHLTAGWLALTGGDLTVNREHPPLAKLLAALPLLALNPRLPPRQEDGPAPGSEDFEFHYARSFLYEANDADRLLQAARLPVVLMTLILGAILYVWVREIAGTLPALAALSLAAFEPNLLAHGRLVTTDMGAALFALAFLWSLRSVMRRPSFAAAGACGLILGLALLTKFSTLLLIPVGIALVAAEILMQRRGLVTPACPAGVERLAMLAAIVACTAWAVLLAGYAFDGFPLPRLYLEGIDIARVKNATVEGPTWLMGGISPDGFLSYFVIALLVKSPIPLLLLAAAGAIAGLVRRERRAEMLWLVLPPVAWIAAMSLLTRAQIGVRYVLPAVPFLCAAAGAGLPALFALLAPGAPHPPPAGAAGQKAPGRGVIPGRHSRRRAFLAAAIVLLIGWQAASVLARHPYHLSWFNAIAGGPEGGWRWLVDSNVDWGQDLVGLRRWQEAAGNPPVNLYYFGTADPDYYGIRRLPYGQPRPGWFAASATHLAGVYLPDPDYLRPLRERLPDANIGASIYLYRLDEVPEGLRRPLRRGGSAP
jgi:hypothetical protein